jgi:hypothetical protein
MRGGRGTGVRVGVARDSAWISFGDHWEACKQARAGCFLLRWISSETGIGKFSWRRRFSVFRIGFNREIVVETIPSLAGRPRNVLVEKEENSSLILG